MKHFHTLTGLPRSGTTLLANVLSQHPDVHVTGTSALPACVEAVQRVLSDAPEVQSDLAASPDAYERYLSGLRGLVNGWYQGRRERVVVDKSRGWVNLRLLINQLFPGSVTVFVVRDPRDVVASVERHHAETAVFQGPYGQTVYESVELMMRPDGFVGKPMWWAEDLLRRKTPGVCWVIYEAFAADPVAAVAEVRQRLGLAPFNFNTTSVENVAPDVDAVYRGKFPHDGSGDIAPPTGSWRDVLDEQVAARVASFYPLYMETFGYSGQTKVRRAA